MRKLKRDSKFNTLMEYNHYQIILMAWFISHGHSEAEYVKQLALLYAEHHKDY